MKHARWEADEVAVRMRHDFAEAMTGLHEVQSAFSIEVFAALDAGVLGVDEIAQLLDAPLVIDAELLNA